MIAKEIWIPCFLSWFCLIILSGKRLFWFNEYFARVTLSNKKSSGEKSEAYTIVIKKLIDCSEKAGLSNQAKKYKEELKRIEKQ